MEGAHHDLSSPPRRGAQEKMNRNEIIFEVTDAPEGGYDARARGHGVFTQGEDWEDLKEMGPGRGALPLR